MSQPQRIVSLLASATEILYGLGLSDSIVGVSHECDFPAQALNQLRLTRSHVDAVQSSLQIDQQVKDFAQSGQSLYELDQRLLVELAPDLIVTQAQCDVCAINYEDVLTFVRSHEILCDTPVVALSPNSLADVLDDILRLGDVTCRSRVARQYVAKLEQRVQSVRRAMGDLTVTQRPRVVCIEWVEPLMVAANWTPELVELAGGQNGLSRAGRHSQYVQWSEIVAYDPEVLVLIPCGFDLPRTLREVASLPTNPGWLDLSAVQQGRVFAIDGNAYFNRSGPRLVDSLEILAHLIHPARFRLPAEHVGGPEAWTVFSA